MGFACANLSANEKPAPVMVLHIIHCALLDFLLPGFRDLISVEPVTVQQAGKPTFTNPFQTFSQLDAGAFIKYNRSIQNGVAPTAVQALGAVVPG